MPQKSDKTVHILEGKATLFKRPLTPHWHVRFKAHGKWLRVTTQCEKLEDAKDKAVDIVLNARFRERNDLPVVSKKFTSVAKLAIARMEDAQTVGKGKATFKTYVQVLNNYLMPYLGNYNVDRITLAVLDDFSKWRIEKMNRRPSASVLNNHNSALNRVFDEALERGYMTKTQIPLLRNDGRKTERRPAITIEEYETLGRSLAPWVNEARKGNESRLRQILRDYILILANTGIRPGTESMNLKWHSVGFFEKKGERYLAMNVVGKTGGREVIVRHNAIEYFDRLRCMNEEWAKLSFDDFLKEKVDAYVFRVEGKDMTTAFGKMFSRLLERHDLLEDKTTGKHKSLYSLRHLFATFALTKDRMSIYTLAEHMGTSVKMIEDHYGQVLLRDKAHEIAGNEDRDAMIEKMKRKGIEKAT